MRSAVAVALAGVCICVAACSEKSCLTALCLDQLEITIATSSGQQFPAGTYTIDVTGDSKVFHARCEVGTAGGACTALPGSDVSANILASRVSADGKTLTLTVSDGSAQAQVAVSHNGTSVASQEVRPSYTVTPADACRSECRSGTVEVNVGAL